MKVAFIRYKYDPYGGAERFTQMLMQSLAERAVETHVFARQWRQVETPKIHFHHVGGFRWPRVLRHASFVFLVGRAVRLEDFDLVQSNERTLSQHVYRAGDGVHARWLQLRSLQQGKLRRFAVKLNPFHHYLLWLERRLFEHPDLKAVIVNSNMVRREITSRFRLPDERIHTIYNGVDLKQFHPENRAATGARLRAQLGLRDELPVVLFVGSGFERKGLAPLLQGLAMAGNQALLWVVGKGNRARYQRFAKRLSLDHRVTFWGPQKDVVSFYAAADIFALPTIYDPFPTAVLEALASGLPTITTTQCGVAEVMNPGEEGFILQSPGATAKLADYLNRLYRSDLRQTMSAKARKKAEAFPLKKTLDDMQDLYRSLLQLD